MKKKLIRNIVKAENLDAIQQGSVNLLRHIENLDKFGVPSIIAINHFVTDTPAEIVDVWRGAIKKMTEDPDFIEAAPQNIGPFPVVIGEDVRGIIGKAVDLSDASKQQFNDAIAHYKLTYRIQ